jgi:3-isopropylmalate dehydrogenase
MMLRTSFDLPQEADTIEAAVEWVLTAGHRTPDLAGPGEATVNTTAMGDLVVEAIQQ